MKGQVYFVAAVAALAGLLFGYDVGVISGALLYIKQVFDITPDQAGLIVSGVPFGALIGALICGKLNDAIGRKYSLLVTAILFTVGSLLCASAHSIDILITGRCILGLAVGIGSFSAPLYIAELSHKNHRGGLVTFNQLAITIGILLAFVMNYLFSFNGSWRWMMGFGAIPALILLVLVLFLPRSPRWLMLKYKRDEAKSVLEKLHGVEYAKQELAEINAVLSQQQVGWFKAFASKGFLKVLTLGILVSILTQAVGINAIIYYAPTVFKTTGFNENAIALLATAGIGLINVLFTIISIFLFDKAGRRVMLTIGLSGIVLSLIIITASFNYTHSSMTLAWLVLACMMLFVACQALSTGPACWLIPSEIFPMRVRGVGMGLSVAFNWGTNVVVAMLFPIMLMHVGATWAFGVFLIIAVIAWLYFFFCLPETKGVSLEQIEAHAMSNKPMRLLGK